jgi:hypothetical protein
MRVVLSAAAAAVILCYGALRLYKLRHRAQAEANRINNPFSRINNDEDDDGDGGGDAPTAFDDGDGGDEFREDDEELVTARPAASHGN